MARAQSRGAVADPRGRLLARGQQSGPFHDRFTWPSAPIWSRDRLTGLTTIASLDELETVLAGMPRLGTLAVEAAFIDLAGFGLFNTRAGQARRVTKALALLGASLLEVPDILPTRLGGDEFLILAKPGAPGEISSSGTWKPGAASGQT